jgi:hypothetical protein
MKNYITKSSSPFAVNGFIKVLISDESHAQITAQPDAPVYFGEGSAEYKAYEVEYKKKEAEAIALRRATRSVSIRAGREALIAAGVLDKIEAAINAIADAKEKALAKNWLEYSQLYMRNNPFLIKMTAALKMTPEQVDTLFDEAEKLEVK